MLKRQLFGSLASNWMYRCDTDFPFQGFSIFDLYSFRQSPVEKEAFWGSLEFTVNIIKGNIDLTSVDTSRTAHSSWRWRSFYSLNQKWWLTRSSSCWHGRLLSNQSRSVALHLQFQYDVWYSRTGYNNYCTSVSFACDVNRITVGFISSHQRVKTCFTLSSCNNSVAGLRRLWLITTHLIFIFDI